MPHCSTYSMKILLAIADACVCVYLQNNTEIYIYKWIQEVGYMISTMVIRSIHDKRSTDYRSVKVGLEGNYECC